MYCTTCGTQLSVTSRFCPHCGPQRPANDKSVSDIEHDLRFVLPMGTPFSAIAAGYLGLFSVLFVPAPFAIIFGIIGLGTLKHNEEMRGKVRCWVGIIMGSLVTLFFVTMILYALIASP